MSRRKSYIQNIRESDIKAFRHLRSCQHATEAQLKNYISRNRINAYVKQRILTKITHLDNKTKSSKTVYELSKYGREFIKRHVFEFKNCNFYTSTTSINHNLKMSDIYLSKQEDAQMWFTERDIKEQMLEQLVNQGRWEEIEELRGKAISIPDMMYVDRETAELIAVEVITHNYPPEWIDAKIAFSEATGINIEFYKC